MFQYQGIGFRVVEERDLERIRALRNDPSTWMNLTDISSISADGQKEWFRTINRRNDRGYFVVFDQTCDFIGIVRMDEIDHVNRSIRVGADVVPEQRGRGYGRKIYIAIKKYCFDFLNMHRVWLAVLSSNERATRLYQGQGFKVEGRYREAIFRDGKYLDYILMSILEEEYRHDSTLQGVHARDGA